MLNGLKHTLNLVIQFVTHNRKRFFLKRSFVYVLLTLLFGVYIKFQAGDALIQLYHNFITDFETKINLLKLAHFAVIVSRQYAEKEAAITYLEGVIEKLRATREQRIEEPILYIKMQLAVFKLEQGDQKECKKLLEDGKSTLDSMTDIDPSVYASYYWVSSQYHKYRQEFAEFYKSALLYLAYTSVESLSDSFKLVCAYIFLKYYNNKRLKVAGSFIIILCVLSCSIVVLACYLYLYA